MARASSTKRTFKEIVALLQPSDKGVNSLLLSLRVQGVLPCPSPHWDPDTPHRVVLVGDEGQIQKQSPTGEWVPAELRPPSRTRAASPMAELARVEAPDGVRLFISHSSEDVELAKKLINLLEASMTIPESSLRCTSVPGYQLEAGDDTGDVLRANLKSCAVVIGLLTSASLPSQFVLLELGAAWAFEKRVCPLLGPDLTFADLPGPFSQIHAIKMADGAAIASLVDTVAARCAFSLKGNSAKTQHALKEFVGSVNAVGRNVRLPSHGSERRMPLTTSAKEAAIRLRDWAQRKRPQGRVDLTALEEELGLTEGLARACVATALEGYGVEFGDGSAFLTEKVKTVVDTRRGGGGMFGDGGDF